MNDVRSAGSSDQPNEADVYDGEKDGSEDQPQSYFLCCDLGRTQNGFTVVAASDAEEAAHNHAETLALQPLTDVDGNTDAKIGVLALETVNVDFDILTQRRRDRRNRMEEAAV